MQPGQKDEIKDDEQTKKQCRPGFDDLLLMHYLAQRRSEEKAKLPPEQVTPQKLRELAVEEMYGKLKKYIGKCPARGSIKTAFEENQLGLVETVTERLIAEEFSVAIDRNVTQEGETHAVVLTVRWL